ncbi:MAG: 3-deoxy-D-manno-octulosonic acid transferase, partial [Chthoniobacterales bacterium]
LAGAPPTWIHAVSVGEVAVALKLATKMRELEPATRVVLTTTTTTGFAFAAREAHDWMQVMYNPVDFWPVVQRAFAAIRPARMVLVEAEVWPNLTAEARARRVPIALVNARLSGRSERRFRRFRFFVAPVFGCLDLVCVQEQRDIARWQALGVRRERIAEVGSIKYDLSDKRGASRLPFEVLNSLGIDAFNGPILLGGSTHEGEERILADVFLRLRKEFTGLALIIAPRHAERAPEIRLLLEQLGCAVALRSEAVEASRGKPDCLLLDTTGELQDWYGVATVVFMGKSLTAHGGQNPVEAIRAGKPVVYGPHMENFAALARSLIEQEAAIEVRDGIMLEQKCAELLRHAELRDALTQNAERVLVRHRGATERTARLLLSLTSRRAAG